MKVREYKNSMHKKNFQFVINQTDRNNLDDFG